MWKLNRRDFNNHAPTKLKNSASSDCHSYGRIRLNSPIWLKNQHCSKYYVTIPLCALGLPLMCYQAAFPQNCSVEMPFTIFRMVVFQKGVFEVLSDTHSEIWLQKVIALVTRRLWVNSQSIRMFEIFDSLIMSYRLVLSISRQLMHIKHHWNWLIVRHRIVWKSQIEWMGFLS